MVSEVRVKDPETTPRKFPATLLAVSLLALMAVLAGGAALRESVTIDEVSHIGAGVSYLQKLDLRMNQEHPPLPKIVAALPLVLRGVRADYSHISWSFSEKFFPGYLGQWAFGEWLLEKWNEPKTVLAWARFPMLLLTLALGWVIYAFGRRLGDPWGGLLCLAVYVSAPVFLTFGPLVHTDIAVTLFTLLTLWTLAEVWREPSRRNVLLFALSLAAALLSKFTSGILFFAFIAFALSLHFRPVPGQPATKPELRQWRRARRWATFEGIFWAALFVYAFYFVFSWHQPTDALYQIGSTPLALMLRRLLMPPMLYLRAVFFVLLTTKRATFVLGHSYSHGVWFYFPVVFALKASLGFLYLLLLSLLAAVSRKVRGASGIPVIPPQAATHWRILWISLLVFTLACILSPLDLSIRHFSVPFVLLILLLAPLHRILVELRARTRLGGSFVTAVALALVASCLFTAVRAYPYYFPFINSLSFGHPAYALVNDSNVDWNQSLPEVKHFAELHGLLQIGLDEYGFSDPAPFLPQARPWNCQRPVSSDAGQWVALSANMIMDGHNCGWLLQYPHKALAGGSTYAVQLPAQIPAPGTAGGPPLPSAFHEFGGAPFDVRGLFSHSMQHPDDLPRAVEWMQSAFSTGNQPPPFPWDR
jgi:4-amino-4-deoxy-L-arabinose transferase-like glycosyltransferase